MHLHTAGKPLKIPRLHPPKSIHTYRALKSNYDTMSQRENLGSVMNASLRLQDCISIDHTPQKPHRNNQDCTALGSPFQYQPFITSPRSLGLEDSSALFPISSGPPIQYLFPQKSSDNHKLPPLRVHHDRSSKVLGSPFRYKPTGGSLFTPDPPSSCTTRAPSKVFNAGGMAEPLN